MVDSLQNGGIEQIEQRNTASDDHRPTLAHKSYANIPIIDLSREAAETDAVCKELGDAAVQWGIFQIVNHGISSEAMQHIESQGLKFFQSPSERKLKCGDVYDGIGPQRRANSSLARVERILLTPGPLWNSPGEKIKCKSIDDTLSRMWPEGNPQLREAFNTFQRGSEAINLQILRLLARYLGLNEDVFLQHFGPDKSPVYAMRWNFYPMSPDPCETLGARDHTDPDSLTILMQDNVGGLQFCKDGQWHGVRPIEGALVVNIGDCLHAWTNCRLKPACHRVVVDDKDDRLSLAVFVSPEMASPLSAADELVDEDHPRVYKPFVYKELMKRRAEARQCPRKTCSAAHYDLCYLDYFKIRN